MTIRVLAAVVLGGIVFSLPAVAQKNDARDFPPDFREYSGVRFPKTSLPAGNSRWNLRRSCSSATS